MNIGARPDAALVAGPGRDSIVLGDCHLRAKIVKFSACLLLSMLLVGCAFAALPARAQAPGNPTETAGFLPTIHTRAAVTSGAARPIRALPASQRLKLTLALPLRHPADLQAMLRDIYDPRSAHYRHYLSVAEFTERFGPAQADYDKLLAFAAANGLGVTDTAPNRQIVGIEASVADIERVFHVKMGLYRHPTEARDFYAPDREPSVDLDMPLWHITGLDNYAAPHAALATRPLEASPLTGSGPDGRYLASDMRAAYYGNGPLTGAGQAVALFESGGYWPGDVTSYFSNIGQTNTVPIRNIFLDGQSLCSSACSDGEAVADIVQTIGMAPGLSQVLVYIGNFDVDILNRMASDNLARQVSISASWDPADPASDDPIFLQFAAQGQSVFVASGDCGAYVPGATGECSNGVGQYPPQYPQEDAYVTTVGGTVLSTTGPGGSWASELGWNHSGGGYADGIPIPSWQIGAVNGSNGGSTRLRNVPDVAADAAPDSYYCADGSCDGAAGNSALGGTSVAAPRWAGFMALVNQQAALNGRPPIGFFNPALYALGAGGSYGDALHDILGVDNGGFSAVGGYDLVTGWGSPNGPGLIDQLAVPSALVAAVAPSSRSVQLGTAATVFASMINTGPSALGNCRIGLPASAPPGLALSYQTTDPATNAPVGTPGTPATIAGNDGVQTFVLSFQGTAALSKPGLPLDFDCDGTASATTVPGVNTVDLVLSSTQVPDIIALAATASGDGIAHIPSGGGAFAVATSNAGVAAQITAALDYNGATLPVAAGICETDPGTGQCLATPANAVTIGSFTAGATPTFSIFITATGTVPFDPASSRLFVRFLDAGGNERGATSVALQTD
jgi:Pro-kumamolisin, activation domain